MKKLMLLVVLVAVPLLAQQPPVVIDGDFSEWDSLWRVDVNPIPQPEVVGDHSIDPSNPTKYVDTDISQIFITDDSAYIYFYITFNDSADLYRLTDTTIYNGAAAVSLYLDVDKDSSTGLTWGWWGSGYDFFARITHTPDIQAPWGPMPDGFGLYTFEDSLHPGWGFVGPVDTPIVAISVDPPFNKLEAAIPKSAIPELGNDFYLLVVTQEQLDPWGGDYAPDAANLGYQVYHYTLQSLPDAGIAIDGDFSDWDAVSPLAAPLALYNEVEPAGDHSVDSTNLAKYVDTDMNGIYFISDENYLYFYINFNDSADLYNLVDTTLYNGAAAISIYLDVDNDSSTGLTWGWWISGYDFFARITHTPDIQAPWGPMPDGFGLYNYDNSQHPGWGFVGPVDTPIVAISVDPPFNKIECAIPRSAVQGLPETGKISALVVTQEQLDPWGGDYAPDAGALGYQKMFIDVTPVPSVAEGDEHASRNFELNLRVMPVVFRNRAVVSFNMPRNGDVELSIYNALGRRVRTLFSGYLASGAHTFDLESKGLPSGAYFVVLKVGNHADATRTFLLR